jgi:solute carrier family 25 protein 14/30
VVKDGKKIHSTSIVSRFNGMFDVLTRVPRESPQGIYTLYNGLRPALLRQATYGTLKVVVYERLKHALEHSFGVDSPVTCQLISGAMAGALSSAICTPTDLIKVRMAGGDRHYTSISDAFRTIIKEEGFLALYKGVIPTTQRAVVVTLLNLPTYDISKDYLLKHEFKDGVVTHFLASTFAGLFSTYGSNPIDTVKSRIMNQPVDETGKGLLYRNSFHCAVKTVQEEGLTALWKGSIPNVCRNVPWLIIFWCSYEALKGAVQKLEQN